MTDSSFSLVAEVLAHCIGAPVSTVFIDFSIGGVKVVCDDRIFLVSFDDVRELHRQGVFPTFVSDYLRSQLLL